MSHTTTIALEGPAQNHLYKRILVAINDSDPASRALHRAIALAEINAATLSVIVVDEGLPPSQAFVWGVSAMFARILEQDRENISRHVLDDARQQMRGLGPNGDATLLQGDAVEGILDAVRRIGADIIVFGVTPHLGFNRVFHDSIAVELARYSACDVLGVH